MVMCGVRLRSQRQLLLICMAGTANFPEDADDVGASEAPRSDPGRQYAGWAGGGLHVRDCGGSYGATTMEAGVGVDTRTGLGDADSDEAGLAMEAEMAGSESRADVAPKDELAGIAADWTAEVRRMIEEAKIKLKAQHGGGSAGEFWADVGRSDSDRLQTSADRQTMAPRGASEQVGEAGMSGRKVDKVLYVWRRIRTSVLRRVASLGAVLGICSVVK